MRRRAVEERVKMLRKVLEAMLRGKGNVKSLKSVGVRILVAVEVRAGVVLVTYIVVVMAVTGK